MEENTTFAKDLLNILSKAVNARAYGSVEIYFEDGNVTQITQRIIRKIQRPKKQLKKNTKVANVAKGEEPMRTPRL